MDNKTKQDNVPQVKTVEIRKRKTLRQLAVDHYGDNPNLFGGQRDGFVFGYGLCESEMMSEIAELEAENQNHLKHIEKLGKSLGVFIKDGVELKAENAKLREALKQIEYNSLITINAAALNKEGISEFRTLNHVHKVAEQALKGKEVKDA